MIKTIILFLFCTYISFAFSFDRTLFLSYYYSLYNVNNFSIWRYSEFVPREDKNAFIRFMPSIKFHNKYVKFDISYDVRNYSSSIVKSKFRELNIQFEYSNLQLSFGKTYTTFGPGYFYNPISVISKNKNLEDPDNNNFSQELLWLLKFDYFFEDFNISFVNFKYNTWHNYALLNYLYFRGFDFYFLLFYTESKKVEYGFGLSNTFGDALELHSEFMLKNDIEFYYHPILFDKKTNKSYMSEINFIKERNNNLKEIMVGFTYSIYEYNIIGEFYHRDFGITENDYMKLLQYFIYNYERSSNYRSLNCYSVLSFLKEQYLFKDYFFMRIAKDFIKFDISLISILNLNDMSLVYLADIIIPIKNKLTVYFKPIFFNGKNKGEFKNVLYSHIFNFGIRILF